MKKLLLLVSLGIGTHFLAFAQPVGQPVVPQAPYENLSTEDKLVWLAWNHRSEQITQRSEVAIADQEVKIARWAWADNFRTSFNLNEFTIRDDFEPGEGFPFFPRYNLGITLTLGSLIDNPAEIKIARQERLIARAQLTNVQLDLKAEVLEAYYEYRLAVSLYRIGTEQNEQAYTNFLVLSEKFKTGEETLNNYNTAQQQYNTTRAELAELEAQVEITRIRLERYIGVPLEEVITDEG